MSNKHKYIGVKCGILQQQSYIVIHLTWNFTQRLSLIGVWHLF